MTDETPQPAPETPPPAARGRLHPAAWAMVIAVSAVVLIAVLLLGARYGLVSSPGRMFIEARLEGLKVGRLGRLHIAGIEGDIFDDFTIRTLTISDEKGVWLEASDIRVDWNYAALVGRRFHADEIEAGLVRVLRRPSLTPKTSDKGMPVSFDIDALRAKVETLPAFSYRRGLFTLAGELDIERNGPNAGKIVARSLLHEGDFLTLDFLTGDQIRLVADAREAAGGALAGSLGLPADEPFLLNARAKGAPAEGTFTLTVRSGDDVPARAKGAWNEDGGQGAGRFDFAASSLTEGLVRRFGPTATVSVAGRRAAGGLYALDGRASAENLTVAFKGKADLAARKLAPAGLGVAAATHSLQRLAGIPLDGQARFTGVLRGKASDFTLRGALAASALTTGEYRLAKVSGPVSLSREDKEWTLRADLDGQGGQGQGWMAAVLGARPSAQVQAARLPDGRMLLRKVSASGAGLSLDAKGERGLFGGLSFQGQARIANLGAARKGAGGALSADWSARRPSGDNRPWVFTADARGRNFSAGVAELDRLLGQTPRLQMRASYAGGRVEVDRASLDGAVADAKAQGVLAKDGALRFTLDWTAEGPFRAGPVEIAGKASGDGTLTGTLSRPQAELAAHFDQIDLPRLPLTDANAALTFARGEGGTNGRFELTAASGYGPAHLRTGFRFQPGGVDLTGLDADAGGVKAEGALSLRRGRPSTADLTVAVGPGAVLAAGKAQGTVKIVDTASGARADIALSATNATVRGAGQVAIASASINARGPLSRLPLSIEANGSAGPGPWRVNGVGVLASDEGGYTLTMDAGGRVGRARFKTLEDAVIAFGGEARTARLRLDIGRGTASVDARLTGEAADVSAVLDNVALGAFNEDLAGRLDARLSLKGRGEALSGSLDAALENARGRGGPREAELDGTIKARLAGDSLSIEAAATNAQGLRSSASLTLPVEASAAPFRLAIAMRRPVSGRFSADGEIGPLWDLFVGGERSLAGRVVAEGTLSGTLADPRVVGDVKMSGGRFEDGATGLQLTNLTLAAALRGDAIDVSGVTASDGNGGKVSGAGRISLQRDGVSSFRMDLTQFQVIDNDMATATASGRVTLNRDAAGQIKLTGKLTVDRAEIAADPPTPSGVVPMEVVEINKPPGAAQGLQAETSRGAAIALDVDLTAPRRVFVRGRGLDVELSLDAHVGGTTADPVLSGTANVVRGAYEFAGKRFEFDEGGVVHLAADPALIRLNLTATRQDPTLTAVIKVGGTAAKPQITLTSSPALPSDEVLSRVLFGTSASQLSTLEAAQLASGLAALAGGGGFDIIGGLRGLTRLDRLTFGGGESGMTVAGGKYLTDDVYLEIIGGGREGPVVQVEWRVRKNLAVVSRIAGDSDTRLSVRWRRDY